MLHYTLFIIHYSLYIIHYTLFIIPNGVRLAHETLEKLSIPSRARSYIYIYNSTSPFATLATNRTPQGGIHGNSKIKTVLI